MSNRITDAILAGFILYMYLLVYTIKYITMIQVSQYSNELLSWLTHERMNPNAWILYPV